jgi:hypothetical protein
LVVGRKLIRTGLVLVLALAAAGIFSMVGRADDPRFVEPPDSSMGPNPVDSMENVLVKASWHYIDTRTLNHASVRFTVPPGWEFVEGAPYACEQPTNTVVVSCAVGTIRPDDVIAQAVKLKTAGPLDPARVQIDLLFSEGPENPGRTQVEPAPTVQTAVIAAGSATPNQAGKCVDSAGGTVFTTPGAGDSEASADVPDTHELCTPFSITERRRLNATESCIPQYACVLDVVTTDSALFPATDPIKLKITFRGQGISNLPLLFISDARQIQVPECIDDRYANPDKPCYSDKRTRQQSVTWFVNWTGADPGWTG